MALTLTHNMNRLSFLFIGLASVHYFATTTTTTNNSIIVNALQIGPLLSTCVDACERGCMAIRSVQEKRQQQQQRVELQSSTSTSSSTSSSSPSYSSPSFKVDLKDLNDPRSALTEADAAAQMQIVGSLRLTWGGRGGEETLGQLPKIIGEEDDNTDENEMVAFIQNLENKPLKKDMFEEDIGDDTPDIDPSEITIFVDPLDGTREFVEGRLANCQVLVGIAINGEAVAGAVGIPFPSAGCDDGGEDVDYLSKGPTIIYGIADMGSGVVGSTLTRGPYPLDHHIDGVKFPRPHHATGDSTAPVMEACRKGAITKFGGSNVIYGGAGNKILAAALGEVACSIQHKVGGAWDLCASHAILKAMGGKMTDLFGEEISIYRDDAPPRCNERGYLATPPGSEDLFHEALAAAMVALPEVQEYRKEIESL